MKWFDVDKAGLAKLLERRGKEFILAELLQNSYDEQTTKVVAALERLPGSRYVTVTVEDDNPAGFIDLTHAFTLFAESSKKSNVQKRGRFNLGEKLVLALCESAEISTTTGTVIFDKEGRRLSRKRRERGSVFTGVVRMTDEEMAQCTAMVHKIIPPAGITTVYNGVTLAVRTPLCSVEATLPTEVADAEGFLRKSQRKTKLEIYEALPGETPSLYEMGIPVVETGDRWHVNVMQKIPLNLDRDNVPPSYISAVRAILVDEMREFISHDDANSTWVKDAFQTHGAKLEPETVERVTELRFGFRRVSYDPSDQEANAIAVSKGYTLVYGSQMSKEEWEAARRAGAILPAGQVTPSPKPFSPDGQPLSTVPEASWTDPVRKAVAYMRRVGERLVGQSIRVEVTTDRGWNFAAAYGKGQLTLNQGRLGQKWFSGPLAEINALLIHELGHHYSGNHLSSDYYDALCDLGARLAQLALEEPALFHLS
jgi:hypothetical protein